MPESPGIQKQPGEPREGGGASRKILLLTSPQDRSFWTALMICPGHWGLEEGVLRDSEEAGVDFAPYRAN